MQKFRKKPVVIEAMEWDQTKNRFDIMMSDWKGFSDVVTAFETSASGKIVSSLRLKTLEGTLNVSDGDYIIKGVKGEFYPCKSDIFHKTYDRVAPVLNSCFIHDWKGTEDNCPQCWDK